MDDARFDTLTLARDDPHESPDVRKTNPALRAEALRQLRWQQRHWVRLLAMHVLGTPCLIDPDQRAALSNGLDLLREAGEDVPPRFYQRGSRARTMNVAGGATGTVRLAGLLADITRVLAWFDPEPSTSDPVLSAEHPRPGMEADRGPNLLGSTATNPDSIAPCARKTHGADAAGRASSAGSSRQVVQGGGGVSWKPTDEGHEAAAGGWVVGDRVRARANEIKVRAGSRGTVMGFSSVGGHPLVDFAGSGLVLIRAEHLERDDDAPPEAKSTGGSRAGTTRLSATPRPSAVAAPPSPPPPDWFDRPPQPQGETEIASPSEQPDEEIAP